MRKLLLFYILSCSLGFLQAQVLINLQIPQAGIHLNNQLWNMTLINVGGTATDIRIDMVLLDAASGIPMLSASSREFNLERGTKQIQLSQITPIQYNVLSPQSGVSLSPEGFLPIGNFIVCFSILKRGAEEFEKIAEECDDLSVEPASPPILMYPEDESRVEESRPFFTWLPPTPTFLFTELAYDFTLVEVLVNQNSSDAIQNNLPILQQTFIPNSFLQYPLSSSALDTGKLYAWQVKAMNNFQPVSNTEVFSFRLMTNSDTSNHLKRPFVKLKQLSEVAFTVCRGELLYEYVNSNNHRSLTLELTDISVVGNPQLQLSLPTQAIQYGQNFLQLDLSTNTNMKNNHTYQLVAYPPNGEKQAIKFIFFKPE